MQLKKFVNSLVNDDVYAWLFHADLLPEMRVVWKDVEVRFDSYSGQLADAEEAELEKHGLTGRELRFKFNVIDFFQRRFFDFLSTGSKTHIRNALKKLLKIIDILFRSALSAVPGGGAIEEYKSFVEALVSGEEG